MHFIITTQPNQCQCAVYQTNHSRASIATRVGGAMQNCTTSKEAAHGRKYSELPNIQGQPNHWGFLI